MPPPDEMRLSYLDHVPDLLYLYRDAQLIDDADEAALMRLERFLMRPTREVMPYRRWSAVPESEEWDHAGACSGCFGQSEQTDVGEATG